MGKSEEFCDAFSTYRDQRVLTISLHGEPIVMLLDWAGVRAAAHDWTTFSSDAPFRVPIPSEEDVRSVRQLPIEADPPLHVAIRQQLEPRFRRPRQHHYLAQVRQLVSAQLAAAKQSGEIDLVREFALPLQSRALALLLDMPAEAGETWTKWGLHVFRGGEDPAARGSELETYIQGELERAARAPGADFFSDLKTMTLNGRALNQDEMMGIANLVFAGGRDTLINAISQLVIAFSKQPDAFRRVAANQRGTNLAVEEILRIASPLTHIGRVCPAQTDVEGHDVPAGARISLCWAAANYDPTVFSAPETLDIERAPNPHLAFGSGPHTCLGAVHARAILRELLGALANDISGIEICDVQPAQEDIGPITRTAGIASARVIFRNTGS